jgi:hypothetical protein
MVLEDYSSLGMGLQILLPQIDFGDFLMVAERGVILAKFVWIAMSMTTEIRTIYSLATSTKLFGCY